SIKAERLAYFACGKGGTALQRAVVAVLDVAGIAIPRPPAHQARRWWNAGFLSRSLRVQVEEHEKNFPSQHRFGRIAHTLHRISILSDQFIRWPRSSCAAVITVRALPTGRRRM